MIRIAYTLIISMAYLLFRFVILEVFQIESEFFFIIGTISVVILYFIKELPLLFISYKKSFKKRIITYLFSGFITSLLFTLFYMNFSELDSNLLKGILLLSFELHMTAIMIYYLPVETYKVLRRRARIIV